jgi:hypothetical protein
MCILIISCLVFSSGLLIYTLLSILPGRVNAGSSKSALFVAPTKNIPELLVKPSNPINNSFNVESLSELEVSESLERFLPTASISSINKIQGIFFFARSNNSLTLELPTPTYLS